ncbi:MAG: IclR family transcriptional regulator [Desulfobacterales bacterium]|nr:IclR family transcriptional regulator [Desulfobacterales bacterium]
MTENKKAYYKISTLEKGLQVIELLAKNKTLSVTEVAKHLDQNRSASHRFLATLHELGYVLKDSQSRYRLSLKLFEIANHIDDVDEVRSMTRPFMRELSTTHRETVNLGRLEGSDVVTIDTVLGPEVIKFDSRIGERSPAHTLAMGKAILAFRSKEEQTTYAENARFSRLTPKTIATKTAFKKELEAIRNQGFAMDEEEWCLGLRCVAIPLFNDTEPSYALSVSGPTSRMTPEKVSALQSELLMVSRALSQKFNR